VEIVVATGEWLYDDSVPMVVRIVKLDYDFWFAIGEADGKLEEREQPTLNGDGVLFYVRHRPGWMEGDAFWPDSEGFASQEEAQAAAEGSLPSAVEWK
jgi:hypothetical protein